MNNIHVKYILTAYNRKVERGDIIREFFFSNNTSIVFYPYYGMNAAILVSNVVENGWDHAASKLKQFGNMYLPIHTFKMFQDLVYGGITCIVWTWLLEDTILPVAAMLNGIIFEPEIGAALHFFFPTSIPRLFTLSIHPLFCSCWLAGGVHPFTFRRYFDSRSNMAQS
jgi:hypothetical protein